MAKFVWDKAAKRWQPIEARAYSEAPAIVSDNVDWYSHATAKRYTSKRAFYREAEKAGWSMDRDSRASLTPKRDWTASRKQVEADLKSAAQKLGLY